MLKIAPNENNISTDFRVGRLRWCWANRHRLLARRCGTSCKVQTEISDMSISVWAAIFRSPPPMLNKCSKRRKRGIVNFTNDLETVFRLPFPNLKFGKDNLIDSLRISDKTLWGESAIIISEKDENRTEDGLLPLCLFRSIYFNHKTGFIIFNPKLSKWILTFQHNVNSLQ